MKVLIIGVGYWGPNVVRNLVDFPEVEQIGISDLDPKKVDAIVARFPRTRVEPPAPECFNLGYDAAIIVTPVKTHASLAMQALQTGHHVLVEKPITQTSDEAKQLIALAESVDKRLMVGHVFHFKPSVCALVDLVSSGELGTIRYIDSVRVNLGLFRSDVNVLWDLAPHDLTIFEALLNRTPNRVSAIGACHVPRPENNQETMVHMTLDYGNECLAHVHVNWFSPLKQRLMVVAGDKKMAVYDDISPTEPIKVYDCGTYEPDKDTPVYPALRTGDIHSPYIRNREPLSIQLREFFDAIIESRCPVTDGKSGLRLVRVLESAMQSINNDGRFVDIVY
jgi:predicted dehydrogenase